MEPSLEPSAGSGSVSFPPLPDGYKMGHWTRPGHEAKVHAVLAFSTPKKSEPEPEIIGPDPELLTPKFSPASPPFAVSTKTSPDKTLALIGRAIRAGGDLDLYNAGLGDEGARSLGPALAKLPKDRSFAAIFLGGNRLSAVGASSVAVGLRHGCGRFITSLGIDNNPLIGDAGMKGLAKALPATLECLYLSQINLGNDGMASLAAALPRTRIRILDFSANQVADGGWENLAASIPNLPTLRRVFAQKNLLSSGATVDKLAAAIREVKGKQTVTAGLVSPTGGIEKLQLQDNPVMDDPTALAVLAATAKEVGLQLGTNSLQSSSPSPTRVPGAGGRTPQAKMVVLSSASPPATVAGGALAARKAAAARAAAAAQLLNSSSGSARAPLHDILER